MDNLKKNIKIFSDRWDITWNFFIDMEEELEKKLNKMSDDIRPNGKALDYDILQQFRDVDRIYTSLLRGGMLIQFCSLVEYTIGQACTLLIPKYKKEYKKKKGNWLEKNLELLGSNGITGIATEDVSSFCDFITMRNCLVHFCGKIDKCKSPDKVRHSIERLQKLGQKQNVDIASETNGRAILGVDVLPEVVIRGGNIIRKIFEYGLNNVSKKS